MAKEPRIRLYGSDTCPYCVAARSLLATKGLEFEDVPVGDPALRKLMEEQSGGRTVPQIFVDDQPIGGFDELYLLNQSGELDRLLGTTEHR